MAVYRKNRVRSAIPYWTVPFLTSVFMAPVRVLTSGPRTWTNLGTQVLSVLVALTACTGMMSLVRRWYVRTSDTAAEVRYGVRTVIPYSAIESVRLSRDLLVLRVSDPTAVRWRFQRKKQRARLRKREYQVRTPEAGRILADLVERGVPHEDPTRIVATHAYTGPPHSGHAGRR